MKKVPVRKCVVTGEMKPKKELVRIVRSQEGIVSVDVTGKKTGRGAYITLTQTCVELAKKKNMLKNHLKAEIKEELYTELLEMARKMEVSKHG